jgi:hypothetical protein
VNAVDEIMAAAERDGAAELPALTQAELCVLGAASKSLICKRTWDWWTAMDDGKQADLTAKTLELLAIRKLLLPARGGTPIAPAPELGMILAARTYPEPIVACQVPGQDAAFHPRFFGMTQQGAGLRALVCELLTERPSGPDGRAEFGTMLSYTLVTPGKAAQIMCAWARTVGGLGTEMRPTIDLFGHDKAGRPFRDRVELRPADKFFDVHRVAAGIPPGRFDDMQVHKMLADTLAGAAL